MNVVATCPAANALICTMRAKAHEGKVAIFVIRVRAAIFNSGNRTSKKTGLFISAARSRFWTVRTILAITFYSWPLPECMSYGLRISESQALAWSLVWNTAYSNLTVIETTCSVTWIGCLFASGVGDPVAIPQQAPMLFHVETVDARDAAASARLKAFRQNAFCVRTLKVAVA